MIEMRLDSYLCYSYTAAGVLFRSVIARSQLVARSLWSLLHTRSSTSLPPLCSAAHMAPPLSHAAAAAQPCAAAAAVFFSFWSFLQGKARRSLSVVARRTRRPPKATTDCAATRSAMYIVCVQ